MPTQRLSMRRIREVLRLRHQGLTERVIARMIGVSNGVVHGYLRRARFAGLTAPYTILVAPASAAARRADRPARSGGAAWAALRLLTTSPFS